VSASEPHNGIHHGDEFRGGRPPVMTVARWAMPLGMVQFMKAVTEVEGAFAEIRERAMTVAPDEAKHIEDRLFAVKADADKCCFPRATLECESLKVKVEKLAAGLSERQAEIETCWRSLVATLPGALASHHAKLTRGKCAPVGMTRRWIDTMRAKYAAVQAAWAHAQSAARTGRWAEAVIRGEDARRLSLELEQELRGF